MLGGWLRKRLDRAFCKLRISAWREPARGHGARPPDGSRATRVNEFRGRRTTTPVLPSDHYGLLVTIKPKKRTKRTGGRRDRRRVTPRTRTRPRRKSNIFTRRFSSSHLVSGRITETLNGFVGGRLAGSTSRPRRAPREEGASSSSSPSRRRPSSGPPPLGPRPVAPSSSSSSSSFPLRRLLEAPPPRGVRSPDGGSSLRGAWSYRSRGCTMSVMMSDHAAARRPNARSSRRIARAAARREAPLDDESALEAARRLRPRSAPRHSDRPDLGAARRLARLARLVRPLFARATSAASRDFVVLSSRSNDLAREGAPQPLDSALRRSIIFSRSYSVRSLLVVVASASRRRSRVASSVARSAVLSAASL